jgi:DNA-binding NarL/FixJ family response regulator
MQILCAENSPVTFAAISVLLEIEGYRSIALANNCTEVRANLASQSCDLLISELRFCDGEILDIASELQSSFPNTKILLFTVQDNPTYLARAAAYRVYDFVLKASPSVTLLRSVSAAPSGIAPAESLLRMATTFLCRSEHTANPQTEHLTKRENQILTHLALGLSNREISILLGISLETVKEHVQNILRKLKANDRTEAAVWALRNGVPTLRFPLR